MSEDDKIAAAWEQGDFAALMRMMWESREAVERGEYCECALPIGETMTCGHCLRRSKSAELAAVHRIVDAHAFLPGDRLDGLLCEQCSMGEDALRHHGEPAIGRTSWGESVQGASS